jgi:glycosyltransferase involved in cell wall biosynthesis
MKILILIYTYYPSNSPRSLRWTSIAEGLVKSGYEVHVITDAFKSQPNYVVINDVIIHRYSLNIFGSLNLFRFSNSNAKAIDGRDSINIGNFKSLSNYLNYIFRNYTIRSLKNLFRKLYWPDANFMWIFSAFFKARKVLKNKDFDVLITVSHPFSTHVAGMLINRLFSIKTWVADSGDPFAFSFDAPTNNFKLWKRLNFKFENNLINSVNYFCCTTTQTGNLYNKYFLPPKKNIVVIPPLISDTVTNFFNDSLDISDNFEIKLLFSGRFYDKIRPPSLMLDLVEKIVNFSESLRYRLKLYIIGSTDLIADELIARPILKNIIILCGDKSHIETLQAIKLSHCLVNVGNSTLYQLPSKVIEYMASGKPILNITSTLNDSSSLILRKYEHHFNWNVSDANTRIDDLCHFLEKCQNKIISRDTRDVLLAEYKLNSILNKYIDLFKN